MEPSQIEDLFFLAFETSYYEKLRKNETYCHIFLQIGQMEWQQILYRRYGIWDMNI